MRNTRYPLVRLPSDTQVTLFLIKEELKTRKLFHALHKVGMGDCYFEPHLDALILQSAGIYKVSDKIFEVYNAIMDKRSKKIETDNDLIMKQAMKAYMELKSLKKKTQRNS
jgi:hypothetical protein